MSDIIPKRPHRRRSWAEPYKIKVVEPLKTIPLRVYTQAHMDITAETVEEVYFNREKVRGLKMVYEPKYLRFFQARFELL
jgi:tryptophanase